MQCVLSCSGGLDSTSLLLVALAKDYKTTIINFDYGSKQNKHELEYLKRNLEYFRSKGLEIGYRTIDISQALGNVKSSLTRDDIETPKGEEYNEANRRVTVVPNRNAIFSSIIYAQALSLYMDTGEDVAIALGVHAGDNESYPDCRLSFFKKLYAAFSEGNYDSEHISLMIPFVNSHKSEVLRAGLEACLDLGLDYKTVYSNTLSCYSPNKDGLACGMCATCKDRLIAWENNKLIDPATYAIDPKM